MRRGLGMHTDHCALCSISQPRKRTGRRHTPLRISLRGRGTPVQAVRTHALFRPLQVGEVRQLLRLVRCQANRKRLLQGVPQGTYIRTRSGRAGQGAATNRRPALHCTARLHLIHLVPGTQTTGPGRRRTGSRTTRKTIY